MKIKETLQSEHVEVTLRMGITMFLGYALTFADISAVPIETHVLLGILVPFCTMLFPTLMFTFGSVILPLISVFFLLYLSTLLLLSVAVVGGNGAYIVTFAIWCFWITFFRFDKVQGNKCSLVLIGVVFQTILIWPTYDTVQNGFTVPNKFVLPNIEKALIGYTADAVQVAMSKGVGTHMIHIETGTLAGRIAQITINADGTYQAFFEGGMWIIQAMWTCTGTQNPLASNSNLTIFVCWLILILAVGVLTPPFRTMRSAVWRGILPAALRDAAKSIRLHAARLDMYSRAKAANDIENGNDTGTKTGTNTGDDEKNPNTSEKERLTTRGRCVYHINALFGGTLAKYTAFEPRLLACKPMEWTVATLVQLSSAVSRCVRIAVGIELLVQTDDEKEFLHQNMDQYLEVAVTLETCAKALMIGDVNILNEIDERNKEPKDVANTNTTTTTTTLENNAKVLLTGDMNSIAEAEVSSEAQNKSEEPLITKNDEELEELEDNVNASRTKNGDYEEISPDDGTDGPPSIERTDEPPAIEIPDEMNYDPFQFKKYTDDVVALTRKWLEAMSPRTTSAISCSFSSVSLKAFWNVLYPWVLFQISHFTFMVQLVKNLFDKSYWKSLLHSSYDKNIRSRLIWCIKYTFGMTLLLAMGIYWPAYMQDFVVMVPKDDPRRLIYSSQNGGWAIIAYCFATTQTTEGSVKKGILRMAGTILGAFSGWLVLVACEDSSFLHGYNVYGVVAWLSITSFVATYISTERGFAARISLSNDYAYGPIYFVLTQIIIVAYGYYYYEPEERDDLTINRMVANLMGIALAVVLAVIPPGLWGSDPEHCRSLVTYHWNTTTDILRLLLSCPLNPDDGMPVEDFCAEAARDLMQLNGQIQTESLRLQELAVDFEKDAARLQKWSRFHVDPRLKLEIAKVTRDIHITAFIPLLASNMLTDAKKREALLGRESHGRKELETLLAKMEGGIIGGKMHVPSESKYQVTTTAPTSNVLSDEEKDVELLLRTINWLLNEMYGHEELLDGINWGF